MIHLMSKIFRCAVFSIFLLSIPTVFADDLYPADLQPLLNGADTPINRTPGFYVGINGGYSPIFARYQRRPASEGEKGKWEDLKIGEGLGYSLFMGYQFNGFLALESGYSRFSDFNGIVKFHDDPYSSLGIHIKNEALYSALKLILPLGNRFQLYGKAGGAYLIGSASLLVDNGLKFTQDVNGLAPYAAVGFAYYISNHTAFTYEAACTAIETQPVNIPRVDVAMCMGTMGLTYRF